MSKQRQTKRYPEVEARLRAWLSQQYTKRQITGPWALVSRKVASEMGAYHGTVGAALAQFARTPGEGIVQISPGNYEYMPPRRPPTPAVLAGKTTVPAAPAPPAPLPAAEPAQPAKRTYKVKRTIDMTLRPRLIQHARDVWREKGEVTIVTANTVAAALGSKPSSTGAALLVLSKEHPEVGYVRIGGGVYEIHRPRRIRPVQEPDPQPQYEDDDPEPEVPEPVQPESVTTQVFGPVDDHEPEHPHWSQPPVPQAVQPQPEESGEWRTMRAGERYALLENVSDGSVWRAEKLDLS